VLEEIRQVAKAGQGPAAEKAFEDAVSLLERGRDGPAMVAAAEAKARAPRSGVIREVLGLALYRSGRFRDALRELQAYRRITGRLDQNHLMADCYRGIGAPEKALPLAKEALAARLSDEVRAEAAIVGASALSDLGRHAEALGMVRGFPVRSDQAQAFEYRLWYVAGDILWRTGRRQEAAEEFRRIMRHDPDAFDVAERLASMGG
jgi:tetratricopeptide (TPR) repeat protein